MEMRKCNVCEKDKDLTCFHKARGFPLGLSYTCKECARTRTRKWKRDNREYDLKQKKEYWNKTRHLKVKDPSKKRGVPKTEEQLLELKISRRASVRKYCSKRRQQIRDTSQCSMYAYDPELLDFLFTEIYKLAGEREQCTGVKWHVDHIIPMNGKDVCGLHIPENLQVITATENLHKSNKSTDRILI